LVALPRVDCTVEKLSLRHPAQAGNNDAQLLVLRSIESKLGEIADLLRTGQ
jgi:hypothetical protein